MLKLSLIPSDRKVAMRTREVVIGDRIFLEIVYDPPERRRQDEEDEEKPRSRVRIGELVPDAYQM